MFISSLTQKCVIPFKLMIIKNSFILIPASISLYCGGAFLSNLNKKEICTHHVHLHILRKDVFELFKGKNASRAASASFACHL